MNVIQVTGCDVGGGAEVVVRLHHSQLVQSGHRSQLLVGRKRSDDEMTSEIPFRRGPKGLLRTARWIERSTGLQNLYSPGFRAIEDSFAFPPDILHFHSLHGIESFAELSVLKRLSKTYRCLISLHDLWLMTGHCGHPLECQRWKTGCGRCPDLTLYPAVSADSTRLNHIRKRLVFKNTSIELAVPSTWLKEQVQQSPILKHLPVTVIPNPVDTDTFCPGNNIEDRNEFGIKPSDKVILLVAQHLTNPYKGIEDGILVLNRLRQSDLKVVLVGNAADEIAARIHAECVTLPFTESPAELARHYRLADLLLMPSRGETFGLVAAEAMACGTPVAAFQVGGLSDVIGEDVGGTIVANRDCDALATEIDRLLGNENLLRKKSEQGRMRAVERFPQSLHTERCVSLYEKMLATRPIKY